MDLRRPPCAGLSPGRVSDWGVKSDDATGYLDKGCLKPAVFLLRCVLSMGGVGAGVTSFRLMSCMHRGAVYHLLTDCSELLSFRASMKHERELSHFFSYGNLVVTR